ncbi:hypothetical protein [Bradyrhizobium genosp. A]|uniref:hypothetical protein n=1 Tax=Bradyrhizobium genosp. A TaxID=83626 RepID=UPI003CEB6449
MKDFIGGSNDHSENELQRLSEFMRTAAYLDKRQQQILQSQQAIIGLQRSIRNVTIDIAHLLVAAPSAGNQAMLERSLGELNGLANAVAQNAAAVPAGGDSGASRGAGVDLNGMKAAIETHANSPGGNALKDMDDKIRNKAAEIKELSAADPAAVPGTDQAAPGDAKPAGDTPASNLDRVNKLAQAESRTQDNPAASASPDPSPLPNKPGSRSNVAALKLDHAEVAAKSDAAGQHRAQGVEPTAQLAPTPAKVEPTAAAAVRKPPSPGSM